LSTPTEHRPWGAYTTIDEAGRYKVKRITVAPGQALSLQYHHRRSEHWVVVQGSALVQVGENSIAVEAGGYCYIPLGEQHRLANTGEREMVLIEVQCGEYLGEDDIVRLDDRYGRVPPP
jgi:mannose-1-phosphate guanylyltransferase